MARRATPLFSSDMSSTSSWTPACRPYCSLRRPSKPFTGGPGGGVPPVASGASASFVGGVRERRLVPATTAVAVLDRGRRGAQLVDQYLLAGLMVPGDDAGHRLLIGHQRAHPHLHLVAHAEPTASPCVVDLDARRANRHQPARLEGPRELPQRRAAGAPEEDRR